MDAAAAADLALAKAPKGSAIDITQARELRQGWYFPWRCDGPPAAGSKGVVVDKQNGRVVVLGSAYSLERDLSAFDEGYRFGAAFLIVKEVQDQQRALDLLSRLRIREVQPEFAHGVEWRIPRLLTWSELRSRLADLPCKLGPIAVYFAVETLQEMRSSGSLIYELEETRS